MTPTIKVKAFTRIFFDKAKVIDAMDKATHTALNKAGGRIRRTAINSIKTVRVKVRDLSDKERDEYRRACYEAKLAGKPKPKLPQANVSSQPGSPPISQTGLLKQHIYYGFEPSSRSVVIGPAKLNAVGKQVPSVLEFGGKMVVKTRSGRLSVDLAARPYMGPALQKNLSFIPQAFANSIRP